MRLSRRKRLVGALEYMKGEVDDAFTAYHEGTQNGVQCKLRLWSSLRDTLQRIDEEPFANVGWLRVEVPHNGDSAAAVTQALGSRVLTLRYVGPREAEFPAVAYVTIQAGSAEEVASRVQDLQEQGFPVRDWSFGCQRGGDT